MFRMTAGVLFFQAASLVVFDPVNHGRHVGQHHGRAVAIRDDDRLVILAGQKLVVGVDLVRLMDPVEISQRLIHAGLLQRGANVVKVDAVGQQFRRIDLDANGRFLSAADGDQADARHLRDFLREPGVGEILDLGERKSFRGDGQRQDRRVRRIGFAVNGRRGQARGQISLRGIDRRLHLLFGHVNVQVQHELQGDDRTAAGTDRGHLVQSGQFAELPFQRRGDGGRGDIGTRARIKGDHLDRRIIHLGQGGNREHLIGDKARQQNGGHQQ